MLAVHANLFRRRRRIWHCECSERLLSVPTSLSSQIRPEKQYPSLVLLRIFTIHRPSPRRAAAIVRDRPQQSGDFYGNRRLSLSRGVLPAFSPRAATVFLSFQLLRLNQLVLTEHSRPKVKLQALAQLG
jgi:hypothetical protein